MSRRVVGYRDGRAVWVDDGPAVGRVVGFGGVAAGHFSGTVLVRKPAADPRTAAAQRGLERKRVARQAISQSLEVRK